MHLPDGFLDGRTTVLAAGAAITGVSLALRQVRFMEPRRVPMLGLSAAFVFAAQMLNFPVVGGTSGHVIGGALAAVLLGPAAAIIVMTCVLVVQALMFADGGLLALGANILNMGIITTCGAYAVFRGVRLAVPGDRNRATVLAAAFAGWFGTVLGAIACAGQLALSKTAAWQVVFPAMANIHMIIGIGEGLATGLIVATVLRTRPELVESQSEEVSGAGWWAYAVLAAVGLLIFVAPFASPWPDGLESVARKLGFEHYAASSLVQTPFADYRVPFVGSSTAATAVAGIAGAVVVFIAAWLLARVLVPRIHPAGKDAPTGL